MGNSINLAIAAATVLCCLLAMLQESLSKNQS